MDMVDESNLWLGPGTGDIEKTEIALICTVLSYDLSWIVWNDSEGLEGSK